MSAVIVVSIVWFAIVAVLGLLAIAVAPRLQSPAWAREIRKRSALAIDASVAAVGRLTTGTVLALAMWAFVLIAGWLLGMLAHELQGSIDWPAFRWWDAHHLGGRWSSVWWKLTDIGAPNVTQILTLVGAALLVVLYAKRDWWFAPGWWAPSLTILLGYCAEKYSQIILKTVVHRGHPPTTQGSWPSGGMGRLILIYGLIIYFVVRRFWPHSPRVWAAGWTLLGLCASIQAYARLNNLEHWTTDVAGGAIYGLLLLLTMILGYSGLDRASRRAPGPRPQDQVGQSSVSPRQPVA